ncbi:MOSC domain containing protein [Catenulispora acidiphila DSM 44928]|uniref:MOSC domain containing protein n=1 Tax=Catenulispora acidiphila (strain DSM 44928 / JCM 14897 / NBRC 102108 / NRRL B-24433 / ID139908) TaxID=479433 RepID=C7Q5C3_CATAD|nr:MOSC domain-containing protein [Catenulispora acidiphila]ACU75892.1 MOSC domain containing protein [Catenulispora acidiphila DSM 44928]
MSIARPEAGSGLLISVNVGMPRDVELNGEVQQTAIFKRPVPGRVKVADHHMDGDRQADQVNHAGVHKAVYAYSREDLDFWAVELGREIEDGFVGENLTISGYDVSHAVVGERWRVGGAEFEVAQPRIPCWKLGVRAADQSMPRRFERALRPGAYLRVLTEGDVGAGDQVAVASRPAHGFTVADASRIFHRDRAEAPRLLEVAELAPPLKKWARKRLGLPLDDAGESEA